MTNGKKTNSIYPSKVRNKTRIVFLPLPNTEQEILASVISQEKEIKSI